MEWEAARVGFRDVRIEDGQVLVNGQPIVLAGVNRHEHDDRGGKVTTMEMMIKDVELMKQLNFNAVRCCHYPDHQGADIGGTRRRARYRVCVCVCVCAVRACACVVICAVCV